MLTRVADILDTHAFLARRFRWRRRLDPVGVEEAVREAEALCAGRPEDEPAALLLALWRRPNDLTDAWEQLPLVLVENLSHKLGVDVRLDPHDREVQALRMRTIARNPADRATLDHMRAFLAARVRLP
jgi:hypothetical protein